MDVAQQLQYVLLTTNTHNQVVCADQLRTVNCIRIAALSVCVFHKIMGDAWSSNWTAGQALINSNSFACSHCTITGDHS